jgi:hypothetical protein
MMINSWTQSLQRLNEKSLLQVVTPLTTYGLQIPPLLPVVQILKDLFHLKIIDIPTGIRLLTSRLVIQIQIRRKNNKLARRPPFATRGLGALVSYQHQ